MKIEDLEPFDWVRFEVEQYILPLYFLEKESIHKLFNDGRIDDEQICRFYEEVCVEDGVDCEYEPSDFTVTHYKYKKVMSVTKVELPEDRILEKYNKTIYLIAYCIGNETVLKYYFFVRKEEDKEILLHVDNEAKIKYGEDLCANRTEEDENEILLKYFMHFANEDLKRLLDLM